MSDDFCVRWYHHPKHHLITTTSPPKLLKLSPSFLRSSIFIPSFGMLPGRPFWHALSSTLFAHSLVDPFCTLRRRPSSHGPCQPFLNPPPRSTFFTHPWLTSFACFLVNPFTYSQDDPFGTSPGQPTLHNPLSTHSTRPLVNPFCMPLGDPPRTPLVDRLYKASG